MKDTIRCPVCGTIQRIKENGKEVYIHNWKEETKEEINMEKEWSLIRCQGEISLPDKNIDCKYLLGYQIQGNIHNLPPVRFDVMENKNKNLSEFGDEND